MSIKNDRASRSRGFPFSKDRRWNIRRGGFQQLGLKSALLHQGIIALLIFAVLGLAWISVRAWLPAAAQAGDPADEGGSPAPVPAEPAWRRVLRVGFGHAMGPLETMDLTGVDIMVNAARNIYTDTQDEKFHPTEGLLRMVTAGDLGRKSGQGWYPYGGE